MATVDANTGSDPDAAGPDSGPSGSASPPVKPYVAGGTVQAGGGVYIPRRADQELLALCRSGAFAYVLTPRQMGKSSLMVQTAAALRDQEIRSVTVDLSKMGTQLDVEAWYLGVLTIVCRQLKLLPRFMKWWKGHQDLGVTQRMTQFVEEVMLTVIADRIVIFVDEIDTSLNLDFTDDFFIAIRSFYLARADNPAFDRLSFVLCGVATPSDLIQNRQRTPFNIGQRVDLTDFTPAEAQPLAQGLNLPPHDAQEVLGWILGWTGGHPYLTQRLCSALRDMAQEELAQPESQRQWTQGDVAAVVQRIFLERASEQDTNLQFVRDMLTKRSPDLAGGLTVYRDVLRDRTPVADEEQSLVKSHLKLSGVVKRDERGLCVRNPIYQTMFDRQWVAEHLPINWAKRLRRAAIAAGIIFLISALPFGVYAEVSRRQLVKSQEALQQANADLKTVLKKAEQARNDENTQSTRAENQFTVARIRQIEAKLAQGKAEAAQEEAEEQRELAVAARGEELVQRWRAEEQAQIAGEQARIAQVERQIAEAQTVVANTERARAQQATKVAALGEQALRVLYWLPTRNATKALMLAIDGVDQSLKTAPEALNATQSSLLSAAMGQAREEALFQGHTSEVWSVGFSPDGQRIVSGSRDHTVRLWDLNGNPIGEPVQGHTSWVYSVGFSPDGQRIVSGSADTTVKVWPAAWSQWLAIGCNRLRHHPLLHDPESLNDMTDDLIVIAHRTRRTCQSRVWNHPQSIRW